MAALPWVFGAIIRYVMWSAIPQITWRDCKVVVFTICNSSRHMLVGLTFSLLCLPVISGLIVQMGLIDLFGAGTDMLATLIGRE